MVSSMASRSMIFLGSRPPREFPIGTSLSSTDLGVFTADGGYVVEVITVHTAGGGCQAKLTALDQYYLGNSHRARAIGPEAQNFEPELTLPQQASTLREFRKPPSHPRRREPAVVAPFA